MYAYIELTDIEGKGDGSGQDERSDEFDKHNKLHAEAEGAAEILDENELHEVVDGRVDPATALRQKHLECVGHRGLAHGLRHEDLLALGEGPQHERRQIAVLAEQKQVLLVQRVHDVLRVVLDDIRVGQDRHPVVLGALGRFDAVHAEASGQARDTAEDGLERLGEVVRDEVLEDLDG